MAARRIFAGLDIGTTKVCTVIGEADEEGQLEIVGFGRAASEGLRRGVVVDLDATARAIADSVAGAERMAGVTVESVHVGVPAANVECINSHGVVAVSRQDREISQEDVERVLEAARVIPVPPDREVIHVLPREFIVDGCRGIQSPVGMSGIRLEVETHIITGSATSLQNVIKSVTRAGLVVEQATIQPLASGEAVLSPEERELGVAVVDMGGGSTDVAVFQEGSISHTAVIPIAGRHITNDIAVGLRTLYPVAEEIKKNWGCAKADLVDEGEVIDINGSGTSHPVRVSRAMLCRIIEARVREILEMVAAEIAKASKGGQLPAGVVITGGCALLSGISDLASEVLDLPVRVGAPQRIYGMADVVTSPVYSTAVGLVRRSWAEGGGARVQPRQRSRGSSLGSRLSSFIQGIKNWFDDSMTG